MKTIACMLVAGLSLGLLDLRVQPDEENVVSSRLAGDWVLDPDVNERLGGTSAGSSISFRSDSEIAGKIPEKYESFLKAQIFMAGSMQIREESHPFVLTTIRGNPHVVYFRERDGDPMGDAESFNVMLAPAKEEVNDLLLIGGDFNNQPFRAYQRKARAEPR